MPIKLVLDPSRPFQLAEGLLVQWLPRGRDREARAFGLLSSYRLCEEPDCLCTIARMVSRVIDDRAESVIHRGRSQRLRWCGLSEEAPAPEAMAAVDLDVVTGEVSRPGGGELSPRAVASRAGRVGRNEPCPCGSGLKYKKCCGRS